MSVIETKPKRKYVKKGTVPTKLGRPKKAPSSPVVGFKPLTPASTLMGDLLALLGSEADPESKVAAIQTYKVLKGMENFRKGDLPVMESF